jgi:hypothetical protein
MKLVERKDINESEWTRWCTQNPLVGPFCQLEYLDAVAENVLFLIDEGNGGIALPYKVKFGVKTFYTPVFCRWISLVGKQQLTSEKIDGIVKDALRQADVYTQHNLFGGEPEELIYQTVNEQQYSLNTQAKRKIKKAKTEEWKIVFDEPAETAIDLIESALKNKFANLEDSSFPLLRKLATNFEKSGQLKIISLHDSSNKLIGSLLLIESESRVLYLKGACIESVKMKGGMYLLMNEAIQSAFASNKTFDFGGSRIPGVRKFNLSFGSVDQTYFHYKWSNGPFWYTLLKNLGKALKK